MRQRAAIGGDDIARPVIGKAPLDPGAQQHGIQLVGVRPVAVDIHQRGDRDQRHLLGPVADAVIEPVEIAPGPVGRSEEFAVGIGEGLVLDWLF